MDRADIPGFGETLAGFRKRRRMSQQQLADELGKSRRTIIAWEAGDNLPKARGDILELVRLLVLTQEEAIILLETAGMDPAQGVWNVPFFRNPNFTGRDNLLEQLDNYLNSEGKQPEMLTVRVALTQARTIRGLGGIGKTQIAVEYAYRSRDLNRYQHTLWINAAGEESLLTSFIDVAQVLPNFTARSETNQQKLVNAVKRWLERCPQRWLLIFDNADDIEMISTYFPDTSRGNGSILLTTRANAVGALAKAFEVDVMGTVEGAQLLLRRAGRFDNASDDEVNEAGNVVLALDHFPLALDQAGAYIEKIQCSYKTYLQLYRTRRQILLAERGTQTVGYPESVATTWLVSFQQVEAENPAAAELLSLCSFLDPNSIPEEFLIDGASHWPQALRAAVTDSLSFEQMLGDLLKFSLVKRLVGTNALSMHRLVQAVQKDRMKMEVQQQWAERTVRALHAVFPDDPEEDTFRIPYLRFLGQGQNCSGLIGEFGLSFVEASELLNNVATYVEDRGLYEQAEALFRQALVICEQELGTKHPETATLMGNLASLYDTLGRYTEAESLFRRALTIYEGQEGKTSVPMAYILNNLALLCQNQGHYIEAEQLYQRVLSVLKQQNGDVLTDTTSILNNLAFLYVDQGRFAEAESLFQRVLSEKERQRGLEHVSYAVSLGNLAMLYVKQGKFTDAEPLLLRVLSIRERYYGPTHPAIAHDLYNLAAVYRAQERYIEAEQLYVRSLTIVEQQLGPMHPSLASSLNGLALLYQDVKRYVDAEPLLLRALDIREHQLGSTHPDVAMSLNNVAAFYRAQGRYAEAEVYYQRALAIKEQQLGSEHPSTAMSLHNLAFLYHMQKRYTEAEGYYQRALTIRERQLGADHSDTLSTRQALADLHKMIDQDEDAQQMDWQP